MAMADGGDRDMMTEAVEEYRERIFRAVGYPSGDRLRILNLGCGEGYDNVVFGGEGNVVVGVDITFFSERWGGLRSRRSHFVNADGRWLPFVNEVFDYVFLKDVLHHVENHGDLLREVSRVAKGDATVCILEANRYNPVGYLHMTLLGGHDHFSQSYFRSVV